MWRATALVVVVLLCGCSEHVRVVDSAGRPLAGAMVTAVALSTSGAPAVTDAAGAAEVDLPPQQVQWLVVSVPGRPTETIPVEYLAREKGSYVVVLHPETAP